MRIAVGTHCCGKSTLIEAFLLGILNTFMNPRRTKFCRNFMVSLFGRAVG